MFNWMDKTVVRAGKVNWTGLKLNEGRPRSWCSGQLRCFVGWGVGLILVKAFSFNFGVRINDSLITGLERS